MNIHRRTEPYMDDGNHEGEVSIYLSADVFTVVVSRYLRYRLTRPDVREWAIEAHRGPYDRTNAAHVAIMDELWAAAQHAMAVLREEAPE